MLQTIDLRGQNLLDYRSALPRADFDVDAAVERVRPIVAAVAERGSAALAEFSERFDHVVPTSFRVSAEAIRAAEAGLSEELRTAFSEAIRRRRLVAEAEAASDVVRVELAPGRSPSSD